MAYQAILASSNTAAALPSVGASAYQSPSPVSLDPRYNYPPGFDSALDARCCRNYLIPLFFLSLPISTYLSLQPFFPRYQRFVHEGGSAEYSDFLEAILPSLVDVLGDPEDYRLRGRRSGAQRAAADKVKADALAKEVTQRSRLHKASSGPMGFQVPLFIYFFCRS